MTWEHKSGYHILLIRRKKPYTETPRRKEEMQQMHQNVNNDDLFVFSVMSTMNMLFFSIRKKCFCFVFFL